MAASLPSLKTEAGLNALNAQLATRSFLGGDGTQATREDFDLLEKVGCVVDREKFPHAGRWHGQVQALKVIFPFRKWPEGNDSASNKQNIDPIVPRFAAVEKERAVVLKLDGPQAVEGKLVQKHPENPEMGERLILLSKEVWLGQQDAAAMADGEQIALVHWGNAFVDEITRDMTGAVTEMVGHLNLGGNEKDTKKSVHWIPKLDSQVTAAVLREDTVETMAIGDPLLKSLGKGETIQLERRGFFIVDEIAYPAEKPIVLVKIPDGTQGK